MEKKVTFGEFEFPVVKGLSYVIDEGKPESDFLFVNGPGEIFSMYFEDGMKKFTVPDENVSNRDYYLFEFRNSNRKIHFFCPERWKHLNSVILYFYVELFDSQGAIHVLPGQVRVVVDDFWQRIQKGKPRFVEVLEQIKLREAAVTA